MKKFELTTEYKTVGLTKLYRIKALISFGNVEKGELGGYIENEKNLDHASNAWVYDNAEVSGNARVYDNARLYGNARVSGDAWVYGNARVSGDAWVSDNARVYDNAEVSGNARVYGNADYATIKGFGSMFRCTTFFRQKDSGIGVVCGCFYGTLEQFRNKVVQTHGKSKLAEEYLMIADLMEKHFKEDGNNDKN